MNLLNKNNSIKFLVSNYITKIIIVKINLTILILLFLFSNQSLIFSQNKNQIPDQKKGRLYTTEGYEIKFKSLQVNDNLIIYKNSKGKISTIKKNEVLRIDAQSGNEALKWGSVTLGASLVGAGISAIIINPYQKIGGGTIDKRSRNIAIISYTTIFTSLGVLMGISKKKYTTVFDNPSYSSRLRKWQINTTSINNKPAFGFTFIF